MKTTIIALIVVSLAFLTFGCSERATKAVNEKGKDQEAVHKSKTKEPVYTGFVRKVDLKLKTVEVQKENYNLGLAFEISQAKLENYGSIEDIKSGDRVTVKYEVKQGKTVALIISKD